MIEEPMILTKSRGLGRGTGGLTHGDGETYDENSKGCCSLIVVRPSLLL